MHKHIKLLIMMMMMMMIIIIIIMIIIIHKRHDRVCTQLHFNISKEIG